MQDENYMKLALALARNGIGRVNPNPMVGAVIVQNGKIIGQGWHHEYGDLHAERNAITSCKESMKGATLYVTLEPCCHMGKTPPCTEAIISSGIGRVVIGSTDSNPRVSGCGIQILRNHGIKVTEGILKGRCDKLNEVFFHFIQTQTPYVIMKYAMTLDGKIATSTGQSRWITGAEARRRVHEDRNSYAGIMVGVGTILADNPLLTCRLPNGRHPIRIICDTHLRTPLDSQVVQTAHGVKTIIATSCEDVGCYQRYKEMGCEIQWVPKAGDHLDLKVLMTRLGSKNIDSLLLEGGSTLNGSALTAGIVNKVQAYIAPKLFGGSDAKSPIEGIGIKETHDAYQLTEPTITRLGHDLLLESEVIPCSRGL